MIQVSLKWQDKLKFSGINQSGIETIIDGDKKEGTSPMEMVLMALGGCTGVDIVMILQKMRVEFDSFSMELHGDRAESDPKYYKKIKVVYKISGANIPEDKLKRAIDLSVEKYCSVLHSLRKDVEFDFGYEIIGTESK